MKLTTTEIARITRGVAIGADARTDGIAFDSRRVSGRELFVPLRGVRDGHDFIEAAMRSGASAYLTERPEHGGPGVRVEDTRAALHTLAAWARTQIDGPVVAVTGSVGKTTTKDLIAAAVAANRVVHASVASFNNDIGIPHTLLGAPSDTEVLVAEFGSNSPGEIAAHARLARPTIGVITRVAFAHTEGFGGIDAVAREKGALIESLPASGVAILNVDDGRVLAMRELTAATVLTYGTTGDVRAQLISMSDQLQPTIRVETPWGIIAELTLEVRGTHQVANASAAIAAAGSVGVSLDDMASALATARGPALRMDLQTARSGALVLDDSYNANPASMEAAIRALAELPAERHIAVLGTMAELGEHANAEHTRIAELCLELGVEIVAVGTAEYGLEMVPDSNAALYELGDLADGDAVLVKASRRVQLDELAASLRQLG